MPPSEHIKRVRIYLNRADQWDGRPHYLVLMDYLRNAGATGATALQGLAGFGPSHRIRTGMASKIEQHHPVVVEWIDRADRVDRLLLLVDDLIRQCLVTVEDVPVYRAVLRSSGPFTSDRTVADAMPASMPMITVDANLNMAINLLIEHQITMVPIVNPDGVLAGLISEQELAWRLGLRIPPVLLSQLAPTERDMFCVPLIHRSVSEVMNTEPRTVFADTNLPQALATMVEWGYAHVPVIHRDGRLAGIIGQEDVLRIVVEQEMGTDGPVTAAEPRTTVGMVMQTITPQLALGTALHLALDQLLAAPSRSILVTDMAGKLYGTLDLATTLANITGNERASLIVALQQSHPDAIKLETSRSLNDFVTRGVDTLTPNLPITQAAQYLLKHGQESMPVVDDTGRLLGIIARGGLIRALLQQSE